MHRAGANKKDTPKNNISREAMIFLSVCPCSYYIKGKEQIKWKIINLQKNN